MPLIRGVCLLVALASLVYRFGIVALFLPLAGPLFSSDGAYFLFIVAAEITIFGLSLPPTPERLPGSLSSSLQPPVCTGGLSFVEAGFPFGVTLCCL